MYPVTAVLKLRGKEPRGDGVELASLDRPERPNAIPAIIPPAPGGDSRPSLHGAALRRTPGSGDRYTGPAGRPCRTV